MTETGAIARALCPGQVTIYKQKVKVEVKVKMQGRLQVGKMPIFSGQ